MNKPTFKDFIGLLLFSLGASIIHMGMMMIDNRDIQKRIISKLKIDIGAL